MSLVRRLSDLFSSHVGTTRRSDTQRSRERKQHFYTTQLTAMKRWGQVGVVAWK